MLFNSYTFVLIFLPITLGGYLLLRRWENSTWQVGWLTLASLVFYGWWNPPYLVLLLASIGVNYGIGCKLTELPHRRGRQRWLTIGLVFNLALLAYFKYALFFLGNFNAVWGTRFAADQILLPLGISFFTFQQIAFLIDAYRGEVDKTAFSHYCLFVSFFPQLIAGPIVHHGELLPQLRHRIEGRRLAPWLATGVTLFTIGLFKKVVLADHLGSFVAPVFDAAASGQHLTMLVAWLGTLAYTFQLYFDFSGYSDMAIGLASLFGLRLPLNFNSPYKATNISDFWRRWHITLSRFL
ncbi:MAG: membrane-bound O-acyltransferase family protein, partial [Planctomycetaceae bacterium]|nr:membrane-bound O-acyltransferase family protein [Planctomycetaceae bacterium]